MSRCLSCKKTLSRRQTKFCSNKCQFDHQHQIFISSWKENRVSGGVGVSTKVLSRYLRRYLFEKYYNKCGECGWSKKNITSNQVPLEIDHIDGNSDNNSENNLRLLCPNCHSLTAHFRNLNKGNGRKWRLNKYRKEVLSVKYKSRL